MATSDHRTDQELLDAAGAGDDAAFQALYYRHRDWVARLAYRFTGNHDEALDVVQETFFYLLRKLPGLQLTGRLTTFLYPVVKNVSISMGRKSKRYVSGDTGLPETAAAETTDSKTLRDELAIVMKSLPEPQRETLLMRFVDGMELREIATALDIPLGTVKSRLHIALNHLRNDPRTQSYFFADQ